MTIYIHREHPHKPPKFDFETKIWHPQVHSIVFCNGVCEQRLVICPSYESDCFYCSIGTTFPNIPSQPDGQLEPSYFFAHGMYSDSINAIPAQRLARCTDCITDAMIAVYDDCPRRLLKYLIVLPNPTAIASTCRPLKCFRPTGNSLIG